MRRSPLHRLVRAERGRQRGRLAIAAAAAAATAAGAVLLLGLSGWFLAAAALAGAAGPAAAAAFNYLLPSAAIRFLAISRTAGRYLERVAGHEAAFKALARIRPAIFAGLAFAPPEHSLRFSSGEASSRLIRDVDAIETLFVRRSAPWAGAAALICGAGLIGLASPRAAIAFVLAFAAQTVIGVWLGAKTAHEAGAATLVAAGRLKDAFQAVAAASAEIRCYGLGPQVVESLMVESEALGEAQARRRSAEGLANLAPAAMTGLAVAVVLGLVARAPTPLAALAALATAVAMEGGGALARMFDDNGALNAAADRLDEMLRPALATGSSVPSGGVPSFNMRLGADVVTVRPGERLALTGRSGSGKTRLLETLVGLRPPRPGAFAIGGRPIETLAIAEVRALFSLAPQDARMISGTIRDNLALADPAALEDALWTALGEASLRDKVNALTHGLDTWIGEGGERLSGGERRRLSLARAFLRPDARWLLLDEPTEGLDAETESAVVAALGARLRRTGQGAIIVSHREAPLSICSRRHSMSV
jgi:ATP-binding cassette subfamily C protein CydC